LLKNEDYTAVGMDYCPGGELYMLLRAKKCFSELETQFYAASVLQGLEALHMANIIYRE
jgi:protein kinase A